jgi:type IV pilus secretin PilQ/predicted competence protein
MNTKSAHLKFPGKSKRLAAIRLMILLPLLWHSFSQWGSAQMATVPARPTQDKQAPAPLPPNNKAGADKAPLAASLNAITDIKTYQEGGKFYVVLSTNGLLRPKRSMLHNPSRLVVDFHNAINRVPNPSLVVNAGKIKQLRIRQFQESEPKITRLVFDLEDDPGKPEIIADSQSVKIVFSEAAESSKSAAEPSKPAAESPKPPTEGLVKTASAATPAPKPAASRPVVTAPATQAAKPAATQPVVTAIPAPPAPKAAAKQTAMAAAPATAASKPAATQPVKTALAPAPVSHPTPESADHAAKTPKAAAKEKLDPSAKISTVEIPVAAATGTMPPKSPAFPTINLKTASPTAPELQAPAPAPAPPAPPKPSPAVAIAQEGRFTGQPLTLDLVDIPLVDFFRLMAEEGGINVVMDPEIKGTISIKVVKVPWDQIFDAALANNGLDKRIEGNLVRIARKNTLQEEAKQREALKKATLLAADLETRIRRLNYAKAVNFVGPLTEQKTARGTVVIDERTNSLILNDIPDQLEKMLALVDVLDIPQPQVEIEARIVSATRDFARDIGIQFGFVQGNLERVSLGGPNTFGTIGGTRPSQTPKSAYVAGNPYSGRGAAESKSSESAAVSTGVTDQDKGNYNVNLPAGKAFGGLGISIGNIFDTFLLDAAITAGENKGLAKLISQPKVTTANNSAATITQGYRFPVQIVANQTVTVQFQNAALTLTTTPQITYEGNIVLDLKVENNTPDFSRNVNGIPSIRTSESSTRVMVVDGGTTVIGGILLDNESNQEDRVPGLASLPIIGNVFRRTSVTHSTQEVLFFITPRLIK